MTNVADVQGSGPRVSGASGAAGDSAASPAAPAASGGGEEGKIYLVYREKYLLYLWQVPTADPDQRAGAGLPGRQQGGVPVPVLPLPRPRPRPRPAPRGAAQQRQVRGGEAAAGGVPEHAARGGGQGLPHTQAGDTAVKMILQTRASNECSRRFHSHREGPY